MSEDWLIQRVREAIRKWAAKPFQEQLAELVRRGIVDEKGRVIVRFPEPPKRKRKRRSS